MKLPGAERAIIEDAKLSDYLLSSGHPTGRFKAVFFAAMGFDEANWPHLVDELLRHASANDVVSVQATQFGIKHLVQGGFRGYNGRTAHISVVWIVLHGENVPRLVTADPAREKR